MGTNPYSHEDIYAYLDNLHVFIADLFCGLMLNTVSFLLYIYMNLSSTVGNGGCLKIKQN